MIYLLGLVYEPANRADFSALLCEIFQPGFALPGFRYDISCPARYRSNVTDKIGGYDSFLLDRISISISAVKTYRQISGNFHCKVFLTIYIS